MPRYKKKTYNQKQKRIIAYLCRCLDIPDIEIADFLQIEIEQIEEWLKYKITADQFCEVGFHVVALEDIGKNIEQGERYFVYFIKMPYLMLTAWDNDRFMMRYYLLSRKVKLQKAR